METIDHRALKSLAISWLIAQGCRAVALEVTCAIPRWRFDAAGWKRTALGAESIVVECKQSRADFLRDDEHLDALVAERLRLTTRRTQIEETRVKVYEPHLRTWEPGLFEERAAWDFTRSKLADYRRVLLGLRRVDQSLHGETKFCLAVRYRLADRCYLLCPQGMIRPREVPEGWGLLECPRRLARRALRDAGVTAAPIRLRVDAAALLSRCDRRERLLFNIAVAASRAAYGHLASGARADGARLADAERISGTLFERAMAEA
ncbi:MAG: hypothetical protein EXS03_06015 [Phycisphaerales bacterium]|nr:hypothetical protein [Phycisphaerales bacterium]